MQGEELFSTVAERQAGLEGSCWMLYLQQPAKKFFQVIYWILYFCINVIIILCFFLGGPFKGQPHYRWCWRAHYRAWGKLGCHHQDGARGSGWAEEKEADCWQEGRETAEAGRRWI